jgi:hypothetical protein
VRKEGTSVSFMSVLLQACSRCFDVTFHFNTIYSEGSLIILVLELKNWQLKFR